MDSEFLRLTYDTCQSYFNKSINLLHYYTILIIISQDYYQVFFSRLRARAYPRVKACKQYGQLQSPWAGLVSQFIINKFDDASADARISIVKQNYLSDSLPTLPVCLLLNYSGAVWQAVVCKILDFKTCFGPNHVL